MDTRPPIDKVAYIFKLIALVFLGSGILGFIAQILSKDWLHLYSSYWGWNSEIIIETLDNIQDLFLGLIFLSLSNNLIRREKWAFYTVIFLLLGFGIIPHGISLISSFSFNSFESLISIIAVGGGSYVFYLLIEGRKDFIGKPKEKISSWFRKTSFLILFAEFFIVIILEIIKLY